MPGTHVTGLSLSTSSACGLLGFLGFLGFLQALRTPDFHFHQTHSALSSFQLSTLNRLNPPVARLPTADVINYDASRSSRGP